MAAVHSAVVKSTLYTLIVLLFRGHPLALILGTDSESLMRDIQYHFTTCGQLGSSGPEYSQCFNAYNSSQSPITRDGLLVNFIERGPDYYQGVQRFRVPRTGYYNVTVAGARGGRGICSTTSGRGLVWRGRVFLSEEQDLLILVGQKGLGPCDEDVITKQNLPLCSNPPANLSEVETCQQEWIDWINNDPQLPAGQGNAVLVISGGGGGGGASFILPVTRSTESVNGLPIVIVPGGGGTAAIERHDFFDRVPRPSSANISDAEQFVLLIDGQDISSPSYLNIQEGSRGFINNSVMNIDSSSIRPGAGGGWSSASIRSSVEGVAIGLNTQGAVGGQDCATLLRGVFTPYVPIRNVNGGFGGGGGQCGGGGGGGGYTGGSVFASFNYIPSGGGYFLSPEQAGYDLNTTTQLSVEFSSEGEGFVDIVPVDCGCAHDCIVNRETFQCTCPNGFLLHPNEVDCYRESSVNVRSLTSTKQGEHVFTPMVFSRNKSISIFGLRAVLEDPGESSAADWSCLLFLLGENNEIAAVTETVTMRDLPAKAIDEVAVVVNSNQMNFNTGQLIYKHLLPTSISVTGALLVSTGSCIISRSLIETNISLLEPRGAALEEEHFNGLDYSMAIDLAVALLSNSTTGMPSSRPPAPTETATIAGILVAVIVGSLCLAISTGLITYALRSKSRKRQNIVAAIKSRTTSIESDHDVGTSDNTISLKSNSAYIQFKNTRDDQVCSDTTLQKFSRHNISLLRTIGKGEFGIVYSAEIISPLNGAKQTVAVKAIKDPLNQDGVNDLKKECRIMSGLHHPNVLTLIGVCLDAETPYIIMPLMERGSLLMYLRSDRDNLLICGQFENKEDCKVLSARRRLLDMCYQIAKGMEYITRLGLVHRDLAARNCMIDRQGILRVSDFGLSESIYTKTYLRVENHRELKLPVKWAAPESINDGIFSEKTDIWSFGVTCWEVFSAGKTPYPGIYALSVINMIEDGYRMEKPKNNACTDQLYTIMMECWYADNKQRPTFTTVLKTLSDELDQLSDYVVATID